MSEHGLFGEMEDVPPRKTRPTRGNRRKRCDDGPVIFGDDAGDLLTRRLVEDHYALALWYAAYTRRRSSFARQLPLEEARSESLDALVRCAHNWDGWRGLKFSTYLGRAVWNAVHRAATHWPLVRNASVVPLSDIVSPSVEDGTTEIMEQREVADEAKRLMALLTGRERLVVRLRFFDGWTMTAIARRLDCGLACTRAILAQALERMREEA